MSSHKGSDLSNIRCAKSLGEFTYKVGILTEEAWDNYPVPINTKKFIEDTFKVKGKLDELEAFWSIINTTRIRSHPAFVAAIETRGKETFENIGTMEIKTINTPLYDIMCKNGSFGSYETLKPINNIIFHETPPGKKLAIILDVSSELLKEIKDVVSVDEFKKFNDPNSSLYWNETVIEIVEKYEVEDCMSYPSQYICDVTSPYCVKDSFLYRKNDICDARWDF